MEITGKVQLRYRLDVYRVNDHYNITISFQKPNGTWELMDFFIRKKLNSVIKLMEKEYSITITDEQLQTVYNV